MKALLLSMIKGYILDLLLEKVVKRLKEKAAQSDNKVDDEAVRLVEQYLHDALK